MSLLESIAVATVVFVVFFFVLYKGWQLIRFLCDRHERREYRRRFGE